MAKAKTEFQCSKCTFISVRWIGCCPQCEEWNSFDEKKQPLKTGLLHQKSAAFSSSSTTELFEFDAISTESHTRISADVHEWDRVLGGGLLPGSFIILTGDPGIGKSTLLMQIAHKISQTHGVFYFSSEESLSQIKKRALRLGITKTNMLLSDQSNLEEIIQVCVEKKPDVVILDSIQNCHFSSNSSSLPGSISQLKEAGFALMQIAKKHTITVLITGHITKDGQMAGPKILEHMVDGVFYLQGADQWQTRILRSVKNRFGTINELGFFQMEEEGLQEIKDINKHLIGKPSYSPGTALTCELEGSRPLLLELQALCVASKFGIPQRVISGIDPKRVIIIAAILEKYLHLKLSSQDIFFKVGGGVKIKESASDLCIALSLLSSYFQKPLPEHSIALGEVSLSGTIKPINHCGLRIKEAEKFGITTIFLSKEQKTDSSKNIVSFKSIYELLSLFPEDE